MFQNEVKACIFHRQVGGFTICRSLIHNMFKIPSFRDFDWVFRYFNYELHNELKACIFHHLVGGSHKYVVHTSFRIGYFVCKGPL